MRTRLYSKKIIVIINLIITGIIFYGCSSKKQIPIVMDHLVMCPTVQAIKTPCGGLPDKANIISIDDIPKAEARSAHVDYLYGECSEKVTSFLDAHTVCQKYIDKLNRSERDRFEDE